MRCDDARRQADAALDGALKADEQDAIEQHLATCPACRAAVAADRRMGDAVRRFARAYPAPRTLHARIDAALTAAPETVPGATPGSGASRPWLRHLKERWARPMASALSGAVLASALTLWIAVPPDRQRLADEVVSAHVRSLLAAHLTDVASSDQHTVKPWFTGKVDVAPPATDLATSGFALIGGRLDYLDGRPVAALVYQHRRHVINVFVMTDTGDGPPVPRSDQGFAIESWRARGLRFIAVSDAAPADLRRLAALLAAEPPSTDQPGAGDGANSAGAGGGVNPGGERPTN
ncbi:MAG: anti-sigma factor [Rhodospirillales bacterium]|nr:anti-sigma factor [Rhodospirillales bacterium]